MCDIPLSDLKILSDNFEEICDACNGHLKEEFDKHLFIVFKNIIYYAKHNRLPLLRSLQIVELEEELDAHRYPIKGYFGTVVEIIQNSIAERFSAAFVGVDLGTDLILTQQLFDQLMNDLKDIVDNVQECFPPKYDIVNLYAKEYHKRFIELFSSLTQQSNACIIFLVKWADYYHQRVSVLGFEISNPTLLKVIDPLIKLYMSSLQTSLFKWFDQVLVNSQKCEPIHQDGQLMTTSPTDMFDIINQQISMAESTLVDTFVSEVITVVLNALIYYSSNEMNLLLGERWQTLSLTYLVTVVNDNGRCCDLIESLKRDSLIQSTNCFHQVIKLALKDIGFLIFQDLNETLQQLFKPAWLSGQVIEPVLVCLKSYFSQDLQPTLLSVYTSRLAINCLDLLNQHYLDGILLESNANKIDVKRLENDLVQIKIFFETVCKKKVVDRHLETLTTIVDLLSTKAPDMILFHRTKLSQLHPELSAKQLEKLSSI